MGSNQRPFLVPARRKKNVNAVASQSKQSSDWTDGEKNESTISRYRVKLLVKKKRGRSNGEKTNKQTNSKIDRQNLTVNEEHEVRTRAVVVPSLF